MQKYVDGKLLNLTDSDIADRAAREVERAPSAFREMRNSLLSDTDWEVIAKLEAFLPDDDSLKVYRQSLRDAPSDLRFPASIMPKRE